MPVTYRRLDDGFSTKISFSLNGDIFLWEKEVKPPGMDAGGRNDTTTMRNARLRTAIPKALVTMTSGTATCAFSSDHKTPLLAMLGRLQQVTWTYPDGRPETHWAWLDKFEENPLKEGEQPTAQVTFEPANQDQSGAETNPTIGTSTSSTTTTTTT